MSTAVEKVEKTSDLSVVFDALCDNWWVLLENPFYKIVTEYDGIQPFNINESQKRLLDYIKSCWIAGVPCLVTIPKPRREGMSTFLELLNLTLLLTQPYYKSLVTAQGEEYAKGLSQILKVAFKELVEDENNPYKFVLSMMPAAVKNNDDMMKFDNGSSVVFVTANKKEGMRSAGYNFWHASELEYYAFPTSFMKGTSPCINKDLPPDGGINRSMIFLESTGKNINGYFADICFKARDNINGYYLLFIKWIDNSKRRSRLRIGEEIEPVNNDRYGNEIKLIKDNPEITLEHIKWRRNTINTDFEGVYKEFEREYPLKLEDCFQANGICVFYNDYLSECEQDKINSPIQEISLVHRDDGTGIVDGFEVVPNGTIKIYTNPPKDAKDWQYRYVVSADTGGMHQGADYSSCHVIDRYLNEVVASYHGHISPADYVYGMIWLSHYFGGTAIIVVESNRDVSQANTSSVSVIDTLARSGYHNIYRRTSYDEIAQKKSSKIGFFTSAGANGTKQKIVDTLRKYFHNHRGINFIFNDIGIIKEARTYVVNTKDNGNAVYEAQEGCKDDRLMSLGIGLLVGEELPQPQKIQKQNYNYTGRSLLG